MSESPPHSSLFSNPKFVFNQKLKNLFRKAYEHYQLAKQYEVEQRVAEADLEFLKMRTLLKSNLRDFHGILVFWFVEMLLISFH